MVILDVALMTAIGSAIVGFLTWSIFTQYRHYGSAELRIRRLRVGDRLVAAEQPEPVRPQVIASQVSAR